MSNGVSASDSAVVSVIAIASVSASAYFNASAAFVAAATPTFALGARLREKVVIVHSICTQ
jgi:hypothetical protein